MSQFVPAVVGATATPDRRKIIPKKAGTALTPATTAAALYACV
jgi:hypothetical protein